MHAGRYVTMALGLGDLGFRGSVHTSVAFKQRFGKAATVEIWKKLFSLMCGQDIQISGYFGE